MGCACNKQKSNGLAAKRAEATPTAAPKAVSTSEPTVRSSGVAASGSRAPMSGRTQSFALEHGGKTARFGSRLERDAAAARTGAKPL